MQRYTVQCELRINEYVEVSLLLLWLWLWLTFTLLLLSAIFRSVKVVLLLVLPKHYALRRKRGLLPQAADDDGARAELTALWLTPDGALLLELLEHNVSMNAACAVVTAAAQGHKCGKTGDVTMRHNTIQHRVTGSHDMEITEGESIPLVDASTNNATHEECEQKT